MANIHLHHYERTMEDSKDAMIDDDDKATKRNNAMVLYRRGCAAYQRGLYDDASSAFLLVDELTLGDEDAALELKRTKQRQEEARCCNYDFLHMGDTVNAMNRRLDYASFISNFETRETVDRGGGLFAVKEIKAGELLLCDRAFCAEFCPDEGEKSSLVINLNTDTIWTGPHATLLVNTVQKLLHDSDLCSAFLDFYDKAYQPRTGRIVNQVPAVDT